MKLAYSTLACPNWTLEQAVDAAQRYNYEGIELRLVDGEIIQPDLPADARQRVRRLCSEANLPIVCMDTSVRIAQPDAAAREAHIRDGLALLEIAAEWETSMMRVFGSPPADTAESDAVAGAVECLQKLAERGAVLGVNVLLETHDAFSKAAVVEKVLSQVQSASAGAIWDILHPLRFGEPVAETLQRLGARLKSVHIKDGSKPADGGTDWPLVPLGEGNVPVPQILSLLRKAGYDGWLVVEWEKKWHPHLAEPEVALPQHEKLMRQYLGELA
jgi:sugar phosphate isomerase/epimerase